MTKKDMLILLVIVIIAGILYVVSQATGFNTQKTPTRVVAALPMADNAYHTTPYTTQPSYQPENTRLPAATLTPASSYLLVTIGDVVFEPYPLLIESDLPITQVDGKTNTVHFTPNGFFMAKASCDNQDCVYQGEVTLENRYFRLLGNQVICLPNQVMLELLSPQEAVIVWGNAHEKQE